MINTVLRYLSCLVFAIGSAALAQHATSIGREVAVTHHLTDGDEFDITLPKLLEHGKTLFLANWTIQEGAGRPQSKGTGASLTYQSAPLVFPRASNRISGPDANSCAGCHNKPFPGGGGD